ncbi:MAG: glucose dehydrogenase [Lysobacteraceae bacterium]|nr:MAG: glucose dehydrogenase [Xanthomonadaceae bacterium]
MPRAAWILPVLLLPLAALAQSPGLPSDLGFQPVVSGLDRPLGVRHAGDTRLFVIQQGGQIRIVDAGVLRPTPFLDLGSTPPPLGFTSGGERGLLGLAFDPDYARNGRFYVYYTDGNGDSVVARYLRSGSDPQRADPGSAQVVLRVDQDFANHNGGDLHFGLDGMLYIGLGDGGSANDPCNRAQTLDPAELDGSSGCEADASFTGSGGDPDSRALLGKLLRIDVSLGGSGGERCGAGGSETGYGIPQDNPYAGSDGICDEIFASGLRNPYRFSVDRRHGDLWIGDVGQNTREEIDRLPAAAGGLNFGWRCREGFLATPGVSCPAPAAFTDPVADHPRSEARSITGGFRYRGPIAELSGLVFYGDFVTGRQFVLSRRSGAWVATTWRDQGGNPSGYGEGADGHLYMADYGGTLYRLVASSPTLFFSGMEADE